jgi:2-polyprenyl-3-methyl-5-hydroxy-6-metoxy-1,4-benzoquinol methylase
MVNLKKRSYAKELLDEDNIPFEDIKRTMQELNSINTLLGGHAITIDGVKAFIKEKDSLHICEIGCGGGDNLQAISKIKKINFAFTGIDLKTACINFAKQQYPSLHANWVASDYQKVNFDVKPDVIFSSLFCHHFIEDELVEMILWMKTNSTKGFFINDLQRNTVAYYLIKWLTRIFSKSYLVKNDAALSVARGFHKKEWINIFERAGITNYSIRWKWAFRYLIVCKNEKFQ